MSMTLEKKEKNKKKNSLPPLHVDIMYTKTVHGLWSRELNAWHHRFRLKATTEMYCQNYKMHTHCHAAVELQVGATIWATTEAEKKNKVTSGGAAERIRKDIFYPKGRVVGGRTVLLCYQVASECDPS